MGTPRRRPSGENLLYCINRYPTDDTARVTDSVRCSRYTFVMNHMAGTPVTGVQLTFDMPPSVPSQLSRRDLGAVYTPAALADWVAQQVLGALQGKSASDQPVILDPACGDGALLEAVRMRTRGRARLYGIDLDPEAVASANRRLSGTATIVHGDALTVDLRSLGIPQPDAVIANPPWGATLEVRASDLRARGYSLARGQFDSYELFIERALEWLSEDAPAVFIIPDSIFQPEHEPTRRLLAERSRLDLVARLGEGIFRDVSRGTAVLLFRPGVPSPEHVVTCVRLRAPERRRVLSGEVSFSTAVANAMHTVNQERLTRNPRAEFRLDVTDADTIPLDKIEQQPLDWSRWLIVGRGVELGKDGAIVRCPQCGQGRPAPKGRFRCASCGALVENANCLTETIITNGEIAPGPEWRPLIVGEDVDRYRAVPSRFIRLGVSGINYKEPSVYATQKLLIRKTGVGLKAAIDESGAYTTQVVFHVQRRPDAPPFMLEYLQGVLCSRVLLAYHLRRSGDSEWRSHPYVTPKTLRDLPIPWPGNEGSKSWRQAEAIAVAARERAAASDGTVVHDLDVHVDRLVAGLYGLSRADCEWVLDVLDQTQDLQAFTQLRLPDRQQLRPVVA
jgi:adenine-specific DNA-methyltransferase